MPGPSAADRKLRRGAGRQAGVVFQPMIFDSMGGVSTEANRVIEGLNQAVADNTDSPIGIATRFWQRVSVDMQRVGHRAFW